MTQITTAEVAQRKGVSIRTVHRMVDAGDLVPSQKLPTRTGAYLFDPAEVERAFAARRASVKAVA